MIYVASSWRNPIHDVFVEMLREVGLEVFNYRETNASFHWREIDSNWDRWSLLEYQAALNTDIVKRAFANDMNALKKSDTVVLILPCGRSAHLELGYAVGSGKKTAIFHKTYATPEPELMSKMVDFQTDSMISLLTWLGATD